jgi:ferredoxin-type protein NapG
VASNVDRKQLGQQSRRSFLANIARTAGGVAMLGLGLGMYSRQSLSLPAQAIRPPGVGSEEDFLAACIRCGLCVRDCPYDTLKLSNLAEDVALGTPYFEARKVPCEMCEDIPCVKACPTGALDPELTDIDDSRMGLAVVVDQETCIAFHGLRCEVCFNVCPIRGKAISLNRLHNERTGKHALFIPIVHSDACTGCGKCEHACILEEAAIKVFPIKLAKGEIGRHYKLGWKEKEKAGGSLVSPDLEHKYNLPEGVDYSYEGEGLIQRKPQPQQQQENDTPFSSNPLDRLNKGIK